MRSRFFVPAVLLICALAPTGGTSVHAESSIVTWLSAFQTTELVEAAEESLATNTTKALEYDRNQRDKKGEIIIGVVFAPGNRQSVETKDRILAPLGATTVLGRKVIPSATALTTSAELERVALARRFSVIMLMPGTAQYAADIARIGRDRKILTVSVVRDYTKYGIALAFKAHQRRLKPVVDQKIARSQGCNFDADYLKRSR